MAMRWATLFACVIVLSVGTARAQAPDSVKLFDESHNAVSGTAKNGVLTWWPGQSYEAVGSAAVSLGSLDSHAPSQVVSFTVGHPPALKVGVTWSPTADVVELVYPPVYKIPIKFWILCAQAQCDHGITDTKKAKLAAFLVWANTRLLKERVGVEIVAVDDDPADDEEWISNQT